MARFENIKVGDKIIATRSGYGSYYSRVAIVKKVNKVSFVCEFDNITITFIQICTAKSTNLKRI